MLDVVEQRAESHDLLLVAVVNPRHEAIFETTGFRVEQGATAAARRNRDVDALLGR